MSDMSDNESNNGDNQSFESLNIEQINDADILNMLHYFSKNTYSSDTEDTEANNSLLRCISLMKLDYTLSTISNNNGELSSNYPSQLPILEYENASNQNVNIGSLAQFSQRTTDTIYESPYNVPKIHELSNRAKFARCRARFPVPVILYRGKYVCRSSTLSRVPEVYGRSGMDYFSSSGAEPNPTSDGEDDVNNEEKSWPLLNKVRTQDIKLLQELRVNTIVDLMVETKKVKLGIYVTSSEKVDKEDRYCDFNIMTLPYPGCEFFRDFYENNYEAEGLFFDWNQNQCNVAVAVPDNPNLSHLRIEWHNYKQWDLVTMTQNYTRYLLKYLQDNNMGILIHCISGWDRTPLFISLLRLSLWADGLVHQSLDEHQILFLTIAYDWMLFGHHLSDRLKKSEVIFYFCFYVLKYISSDEYSIATGRYKVKKHTEKAAEENVNRTDSEPQSEMLLEQELRGSNLSLNSACSTVSSHHNEECNGNSGNCSLEVRDTLSLGASTSPQARRTSPVTVPTGGRRKRTDSSTTTCSVHSNHSNQSSNSAGSWQMVTSTGSLKSSDSNSSADHASMNTLTDVDEWIPEVSMQVPCRKERLKRVRDIFFSCYNASIGVKQKLGALHESLLDKMF